MSSSPVRLWVARSEVLEAALGEPGERGAEAGGLSPEKRVAPKLSDSDVVVVKTPQRVAARVLYLRCVRAPRTSATLAANELLREKIHHMEAGRPLAWRRPKP